MPYLNQQKYIAMRIVVFIRIGIKVIKVQDPSSVEAQQKKTYKNQSFSLFL